MNSMNRTVRNEKGVALPLALFGMVMLTGLLLSFMSMAGMEPDIATNLTDVTQARYVADAGIESGFDSLVTNPNWSAVLLGNDGQPGTSDDGVLVAAGTQLPGLGNIFGTFAATVRNDNQAGDNQITGQAVDPGNDTTDTNGVLIMTASGTAQGVTRQIQVVVGRIAVPPTPAPLACSGVKCEFDTGTIDDDEGAHFHSDGRDHAHDPNDPTLTPWLTGTEPSKWAVSVPPSAGGDDDDDGFDDDDDSTTFKNAVLNAMNNHQINEMDGADSTNPGNDVLRWNDEGQNTIVADATLTPDVIGTFLQNVRAQRGLNLVSVKNQNSAITVTDGVSNDPTINLGTYANPTITYIQDSRGQGQNYTTLTLDGTTSGAGILIVENGDVAIGGNFRWDGIIIVTGKNVGLHFLNGGQSYVYGGLIVNETDPNDGNGNANNGKISEEILIDQHVHGTRSNGDQFTDFSSSQQNRNMVQQMPGLVRLTSWREI